MPALNVLSQEWQVWLTPIVYPSMHTAQSAMQHGMSAFRFREVSGTYAQLESH